MLDLSLPDFAGTYGRSGDNGKITAACIASETKARTALIIIIDYRKIIIIKNTQTPRLATAAISIFTIGT